MNKLPGRISAKAPPGKPKSLLAMGEEGGREEFHPEAAGEFQEGLNASAASGQDPRARRRWEGTTFPVAAVHGVKRTARKSHS